MAPGMLAVVGVPGTYLSSIGTTIDAITLLAAQVPRMFTPPYGLAMETKLRVLSSTGDAISLAGGRSLAADQSLDTQGTFQIVHIAAFEAVDEDALVAVLQREKALLAWLGNQHASGAVIGAANTATFMLAEAGLLDKGIAAVPRHLSNLFRRRYPRIQLETRAAVAEHQEVFTTGAMAAEWLLVAKLIERRMSPYTSRWLSAKTGLQRVRDNTPLAEDPLVASAQFWLGERFAQEFRIADMARDLAVSHATLIRRFERSLSMTPRKYAHLLKMEAAKSMLRSTNRSIDQISLMLGYADTRSFRAAFREHAQTSPTEFRSASAK